MTFGVIAVLVPAGVAYWRAPAPEVSSSDQPKVEPPSPALAPSDSTPTRIVTTPPPPVKEVDGSPKSSALPTTTSITGGPTSNEVAVVPMLSPSSIGRPGPDAKEITNSLGMKLIRIEPGEFEMGSPDTDKDAEDDEKPQHRVRITRPFYLGTTEVTVGQFRRVMESAGYRTEAERDGKGSWGWDEQAKAFKQDPKYTWRSPGFTQTDEHPVVNVSWNDAIAFCNMLSEREGLRPYYRLGAGEQSGGDGYRLPTEAEWEYACRAGTTTCYTSGDDPEALAKVGNIADGTAKAKFPEWIWAIAGEDGYVFTAPVGRFRANSWGLHDMHGNVWEWCGDGYKADYYKESPGADPVGPPQAAGRVVRGGSWSRSPRVCRSANRSWYAPGNRSSDLGFRVARVQSGR